MNSEKKLAKNTLILSICTLLNKGLMFIMVPLFTRWLTVEDYGAFDVFATYVSLLIPIITLASSNAVFRLSIDSDDQKKKEYITNGFILVVINFILAMLIIFCIDYFYNLTLVIPFIVLLAGELLDNYFQGYLRALKKLSLYGLCKSIMVIFVAIAVTVLVRFLNLGLLGLIYGYSVGFLFSSVIIVIVTKFWQYIYGTRISFARIKELVSYSWALVPNDISWWVINVSDRQIINMFIGVAANGIYAVAYKLPNLCASVFGVFNVSWQESAIDNINSENRSVFYESVLNKTLSMLMSLCIGIMSCNFIFFDYIFDQRYTSARLYTPFLVASVIFSTLSLFYGGIQISLKRPKANGLSTVIGAIINIGVNLLLIRFIGLYSAAISTLVSSYAIYVVRKVLLKDSYRFKLNKSQYLYGVLFVYFSISGMFVSSLHFNVLNLVAACFLFVYINKELIKKVLKKVLMPVT